jgi:flavin reductase (DIM6/NTAB) family NADH-FMN oxidoreductase RutF/rubredoxin
MIHFEALFKISYGLYIVSSGNSKRGNGFISNTVFQVTSDPPKFAACCNKDNLSAEIIASTGLFSVTVLHQDADAALIGKFGYRTGRDLDKMEGMRLKYGETGVPIVLDDAIAWLECRVVETFDVASHLIFIGELVAAEILDEGKEPLTYAHYRKVKKGVAPKNAPTYVDQTRLQQKADREEYARYECAACGFIYDERQEDTPFEDLPADWTCPVCGSDKEDFFKL